MTLFRRSFSSVLPLAAVLSVLLTPASAADLKYALVSRDQLMQGLQDAPAKNTDRALELEKMFRSVGCEPSEELVKKLSEPNVICVLPGSTESVIVVGAHLDHVKEGDGIIDDWSGASMLPSLYRSLADMPRSHTFIFIGFGGEEEWLVGSDFHVRHLKPEERKQIAAMINLECLGVSTTKVWTGHSDPYLLKALIAMSKFVQLPLSGADLEYVSTDSESFATYKIPRITIESLTQAMLPLLHSKNDNIKAIDPALYYDSYRLIAAYLALLDQDVPTDGSPLEKRK